MNALYLTPLLNILKVLTLQLLKKRQKEKKEIVVVLHIYGSIWLQ